MDIVDDDDIRSVVFAPLRSFGEELRPGSMSTVRTWQDVIDRSVELCGSRLKAWRALCQEHMCVSLSSFAQILSLLSAPADRLPHIFEYFIQRSDGMVSLHDWDPVMCGLLLRIKRAYVNTCTNTTHFTTRIGDVLRETQTDNTVVHKSHFVEHLMELHVEHDEAATLFDALAPYMGVPLMPFSVLHWLDDWLVEDLDVEHAYEGSKRPLRSYLLQTQTLKAQVKAAQTQRAHRAREAQKDIGAVLTSGTSLRDIFRKRFGNLIRGWRVGFGIDVHCVGRTVVLKACERLHLKVKGTQLWRDLTSQEDKEHLSLTQFAPQEMRRVRRFVTSVNDPVHVFTHVFGQSAGKHEWVEKMHSLHGIEKTLSTTIFEYFTLEPSAQAIMLRDMTCLSYATVHANTRPSFKSLSVAESSAMSLFERGSHQLLPTHTSQRSLVERKNRRALWQNTLSRGPRTLIDALNHIKLYHHNVVHLLRRLFGNSSLDLAWQRFCIVFRTLNYVGNIRHLFTQLDNDKDGVVLLRDWAPDVEATLSRFQNELTHRFPTPSECFDFFDANNNGVVGKTEWSAALRDFADITVNDSNALFTYIAKDPEGTLVLSDIEWLYGALRRQPRGIGDKGLSNYLAAFISIISHKRTKAQGWRDIADVNARGMCRWADFVLACALAGDDHRIDNVKGAWMAIVKKIRRPFLSYADVDAKTAKALLAFKNVILKKHDSVKCAIESVFSPELLATPEQFADALRDLGFHGDPDILQSWVTERRDGDVVLRPWSLCVLDTWVEDCFDPALFGPDGTDTASPAHGGWHKQQHTNELLNARETRFVREYILDQLETETKQHDHTHAAYVLRKWQGE